MVAEMRRHRVGDIIWLRVEVQILMNGTKSQLTSMMGKGPRKYAMTYVVRRYTARASGGCALGLASDPSES